MSAKRERRVRTINTPGPPERARPFCRASARPRAGVSIATTRKAKKDQKQERIRTATFRCARPILRVSGPWPARFASHACHHCTLHLSLRGDLSICRWVPCTLHLPLRCRTARCASRIVAPNNRWAGGFWRPSTLCLPLRARHTSRRVHALPPRHHATHRHRQLQRAGLSDRKAEHVGRLRTGRFGCDASAVDPLRTWRLG